MSELQRKRMLVGALVALLVFVAMSGAVLAQGGVNVEQVRALVVRDYANILGTLTVSGDTTLATVNTGNINTSGNIVVSGVITTTGGYVGITPVATATARPHWCGVQSVNGVATVIPATLTAAGVTTPRAPVVSLGQDITLDGNSVTVSNASGVVTLKVWQLRTAATTTPQAATTPVTVNYCVDGN